MIVADRTRGGLLIRWSRVRVPGGPPGFVQNCVLNYARASHPAPSAVLNEAWSGVACGRSRTWQVSLPSPGAGSLPILTMQQCGAWHPCGTHGSQATHRSASNQGGGCPSAASSLHGGNGSGARRRGRAHAQQGPGCVGSLASGTVSSPQRHRLCPRRLDRRHRRLRPSWAGEPVTPGFGRQLRRSPD